MMKTVHALLIAAAMSGALAGPAGAQTAQERAACQGDAQRLCASAIGRPAEMRACLAQNKASLSPACRQVVEARGR